MRRDRGMVRRAVSRFPTQIAVDHFQTIVSASVPLFHDSLPREWASTSSIQASFHATITYIVNALIPIEFIRLMKKRAIAKILHRLGDRPARIAFAVSNTRFVRHRLERHHDTALRDHQLRLPVLSRSDREIVDTLRSRGVYVTTLAALGIGGSGDMLGRAQALMDGFAGEARRAAAAGREFTSVSPETIFADRTIFQWGVEERLLDIAEAYLGLPVAYDGLNLIYTVANGRDGGTRDWHRDREDRRMLKVAVYCNDVGETGGPFEIISRLDKSQSDSNGYRYAGGDEQELVSTLGADYRDDIVTCKGATGTVIFVDTARYFHRGRPVSSDDRKAIFYSYFCQAPRHPFFCQRSGLSLDQLADLSRNMTPRQQAATLWQRSQPLWSRLIPPAPV